MKLKLKRLRFRKGDIMLVKRSCLSDPKIQLDALMKAGRESGLDFDIPIVIVDKLNDYKVQHADLQENQTNS